MLNLPCCIIVAAATTAAATIATTTTVGANNEIGLQLLILGLGWLLGVLFLAVCELSFLGYLKCRELRHLLRGDGNDEGWVEETESTPDPTPEPPRIISAQSHKPLPARTHLRVVGAPVSLVSRNGHTPNAAAALRRNAGNQEDMDAYRKALT